jgi:hypothetical protein
METKLELEEVGSSVYANHSPRLDIRAVSRIRIDQLEELCSLHSSELLLVPFGLLS